MKKNEKKKSQTHKNQTVKKSLRVLFFASLPSQNTKRRERERERKNHHGCARVADRLSDRDGERKRRERERDRSILSRARAEEEEEKYSLFVHKILFYGIFIEAGAALCKCV